MGTYIPLLKDYEKQILNEMKDQIKRRKNPIIAIGGFSGTGKDTMALYVKEYYKKNHNIDLKITHAGEFVRKIAKESGWDEKNLDDFMRHIKESQNEEFARKVDLEIEKRALRTGLLYGGIFIGRMAPFAIGDWGLTIWMEAAARVIAERIANDKNRPEYGLDVDEITNKIRNRDKTDAQRLEEIYGVSFRECKPLFSFVIRNEGFSKEELKQKLFDFLKKNDPLTS